METFSALLAFCAGNSPVSGEFPAQRPVTRSFDIFFDMHLIKRLSKHSRGRWFETLSRPLWRHCNAVFAYILLTVSRFNHINNTMNMQPSLFPCWSNRIQGHLVNVVGESIVPCNLMNLRMPNLRRNCSDWKMEYQDNNPSDSRCSYIPQIAKFTGPTWPLPWASVHWLVQCTLECQRNATGWPIVHWDTTRPPSEYFQGALEHHWKNLVETAPHWNATGET